VVCRNKEEHERLLLRDLTSLGFTEIICQRLGEGEVEEVLRSLGIEKPRQELVELGRNLLNLELIGGIHLQRPDFDFSAPFDELNLWEEYVRAWGSHEGVTLGEEMLYEASRLARLGLNHPEGLFELGLPLSPAQQRLASWEIVLLVEGRMFRFRHEKFQDFIYAWSAADRRLLPQGILKEILGYKSANVLDWVDMIYMHRGSPIRARFLQEMFNVN
jgi:hypothetical protein